MYLYITHGIISFLMFDENNLGQFEPDSLNAVNAILSDVVRTGHRSGTKILIALGGATDYGFLKLMTEIGNNPTHPLLSLAAQNVVHFVQSNALDGVDLDLECWWGKPGEPDQGGRLKSGGAHPAGYGLTLFARELRRSIPNMLISAAVFGTSWYGNNYDSQLANYVDWLAVMTYDLTGSWNSSPVGPHSELYKIRDQSSYIAEQQGSWPPARSGGTDANPMEDNPISTVEDTLWYWTNPFFSNWQGDGQKIPRYKIAAGVPIYGYDFAYAKDADDLSGQIPPGYKIMRYGSILAQFPDHPLESGNIKRSGNTPTPSFISPPGTYPFSHNIYFETPKTAVSKLNFLKSVGAQGVIIWELSNDVWDNDRSIIKNLYKESGNPTFRPPIEPRPQDKGYRIVNKKSGMAITAPANSGERVYQAPFDANNPAQVFLIENSKIKCAWNPALVLDVQGNSGEDQSPVVIWANNDESGQKFRFVSTTADYYLIRPRPGDANERRFRLAVSRGSTDANAPIVQDAWWNPAEDESLRREDNQQWQFIRVVNHQSHFAPWNWMSQIPGGRKLSELNIPGTHESCARYGGIGGYAMCQTLSLQEQLEAGIRFIDIRCRHVGDGNGNDVFTIHHGQVYQNLNFGEGVRDVCIDFLNRHPSECIVMSIKEEYTPDNVRRTFEQTLNWYIQGTESFWYFGEAMPNSQSFEEKIPLLSEARGKIVLFSRYGNPPTKGIYASPWTDNATFEVNITSGGKLQVQDEYALTVTGGVDDKWDKIARHLNAAINGNSSDWYINFLSGTLIPLSVPAQIAERMNLRLFNVLLSKSPETFGTLMMDFPIEPLISTIISLNPDIRPIGQ